MNLYSFSRVVEKADVLEIARVRATSEKEAREILAVNAYLWDVDDYSGGSDGYRLRHFRLFLAVLALLSVRSGGGFAWVVCHFHGTMAQREQKRWGRKFLDRAVAVPIQRIVDARIVEGARTLDFDWFLANGLELELVGRTSTDRAWVPWILGSEAGKAMQS